MDGEIVLPPIPLYEDIYRRLLFQLNSRDYRNYRHKLETGVWLYNTAMIPYLQARIKNYYLLNGKPNPSGLGGQNWEYQKKILEEKKTAQGPKDWNAISQEEQRIAEGRVKEEIFRMSDINWEEWFLNALQADYSFLPPIPEWESQILIVKMASINWSVSQKYWNKPQ